MEQRAVSTLMRIKQEDGSYIIYLPVTTAREVIVDTSANRTLEDTINNIIKITEASCFSILEDFASIVGELAGLINDNILTKHIYRNNLKTPDDLIITNGEFKPGSLVNGLSNKLKFTLQQPIECNAPLKFKFTEIATKTSDVTTKISVTFNALDSAPTWIDYTAKFLEGEYIDIPQEIHNIKDKSRPWALNIVYESTISSESGSIEVSDFTLLNI